MFYNKKVNSIIVKSDQAGKRLDHILSISLPNYSRSRIKQWILNKRIIINNHVSILPKRKMVEGELIEIKDIGDVNIYHEDNIHIVPQNIPLDIIYEDDDIIVINKPSNIVVHPGSGNYKNTILNALLYWYPDTIKISERSGIVHRLDKDTSGLMIIAKTYAAYTNLLLSFKERKIIKEYDAVVFGGFLYNVGVINQPIQRHSVRRTSMAVHNLGKSAVTCYSVVDSFNMFSRLRISMKTGRTHQIRVHMAYVNHPIVGDQKYGNCAFFKKKISNSLYNHLQYCFNRQALHACTLQLLHPVTKINMQWHIPLPEDIMNLIKILKNSNNYLI